MRRFVWFQRAAFFRRVPRHKKGWHTLIDSIAFRLYVKRVLREVRRHSSDTYIDRNIISEIEQRVLAETGGDTDEASVKAALKKMEPPKELGLQYRKFYKFSAERPDGFLLFEHFFTNIGAMALLLLTVLTVFRLFPQKEYVAYAVCAVAGVAAAFFAHRCFYNVHFTAATLWVPAFLLLYYPCKQSIAAARETGESFFALFFSYRYHIIFTVLIVMTAAFVATTAILHALAYLPKRKRAVACTVAAVLSAACLAGFVSYAFELRDTYNAQAVVCLSDMRESYSVYEQGGSIAAAQTAAAEQGELYERYAGIYVPANQRTSGSYERLLEIFALYDSDADALIQSYHPGYEPDKRTEPFAYGELGEKVASVKASVALLLQQESSGEPFKQLIEIEQRCHLLCTDFLSALSKAYNAWIYQ